MDADGLLEGLDREQRLAVSSPSLLLAVIAGAGSGKTSVLTRRIAHRIATDSADPRHIVAITFTRQAAGELRHRLTRLGVREQVTAGTFHATALAMLRQHWDDTRRTAPSVTTDRRRLLASACGVDPRSDRVRELATEIDWARARTISPEAYARTAEQLGRRPTLGVRSIADAMNRYDEEKRRRGVVDLDDLLALTLDLMRRDTTFAAAARWRFRHLFVDEAQDLNPLQAALLDEWRRGRDDLTLVGDPHQAIYGFNGADPSLLIAPEERFPGIEIVHLRTNYRCRPEIVGAGLTVLSEAGHRPDLRSARDEGRPVEVQAFADDAAEASGIARYVRERRIPGGSWRAIAVLARTNAQLAPIAEALRSAGIPCRLSGAARAATPLQRALREASEQTSSHLLATWAIDAAQATTGTADLTDDDVVALRRVASAVDEFLATGGGDGSAFLSWVRATDPLRDADEISDGVELLTFHAAKGREWPHVVIAGTCRGLVPHASASSPAEYAEEWRLLYVAITRAAETVTLTYPLRRSGRSTRPNDVVLSLVTDPVPPVPPPSSLKGDRSAPSDEDLRRDALLAWRSRSARAADIVPTSLMSDADIAAIAAACPTTIDELAAVSGVGPLMARRFGERILQVLAEHAATGAGR